MLFEKAFFEKIYEIIKIIQRRCHPETDMFIGASLQLSDCYTGSFIIIKTQHETTIVLFVFLSSIPEDNRVWSFYEESIRIGSDEFLPVFRKKLCFHSFWIKYCAVFVPRNSDVSRKIDGFDMFERIFSVLQCEEVFRFFNGFLHICHGFRLGCLGIDSCMNMIERVCHESRIKLFVGHTVDAVVEMGFSLEE